MDHQHRRRLSRLRTVKPRVDITDVVRRNDELSVRNHVVSIYALHVESTDEICYVGKSIRVKARAKEHIRRYQREGLRVRCEILEEASKDNWIERERYWIARLKPRLNRSRGGESGGTGPRYNQGWPCIPEGIPQEDECWLRDHIGCLDLYRMKVVTQWASLHGADVVPYLNVD